MEKQTQKVPAYISEAISIFEQIVVSEQYSLLEKMMRFTKGEIFVLKILFKSSAPISPSELSEALNSSKGRISAILKSLEKKGEIVREIDTSNRRNIQVCITDTGKEHIMAELMSGYNFLVKSFFNMGEKDTKEFVRLTKKMFDVMKDVK